MRHGVIVITEDTLDNLGDETLAVASSSSPDEELLVFLATVVNTHIEHCVKSLVHFSRRDGGICVGDKHTWTRSCGLLVFNLSVGPTEGT